MDRSIFLKYYVLAKFKRKLHFRPFRKGTKKWKSAIDSVGDKLFSKMIQYITLAAFYLLIRQRNIQPRFFTTCGDRECDSQLDFYCRNMAKWSYSCLDRHCCNAIREQFLISVLIPLVCQEYGVATTKQFWWEKARQIPKLHIEICFLIDDSNLKRLGYERWIQGSVTQLDKYFMVWERYPTIFSLINVASKPLRVLLVRPRVPKRPNERQQSKCAPPSKKPFLMIIEDLIESSCTKKNCLKFESFGFGQTMDILKRNFLKNMSRELRQLSVVFIEFIRSDEVLAKPGYFATVKYEFEQKHATDHNLYVLVLDQRHQCQKRFLVIGVLKWDFDAELASDFYTIFRDFNQKTNVVNTRNTGKLMLFR